MNFVLNNVEYTQCRDIDGLGIDIFSYLVNGVEIRISLNLILKKIFAEFGSAPERPQLPDFISNITPTNRKKVYWYLQAHAHNPSIDIPDIILDIFTYMEKHNSSNSAFFQDWKAIIMATGYDTYAAAALYIYCGPSPSYLNNKTASTKIAVVKFTPLTDRLIITFLKEIPLDMQITAGFNKILTTYLHIRAHELDSPKELSKKLLSAGLTQVYIYNSYRLSIPGQVRKRIISGFNLYITRLLKVPFHDAHKVVIPPLVTDNFHFLPLPAIDENNTYTMELLAKY